MDQPYRFDPYTGQPVTPTRTWLGSGYSSAQSAPQAQQRSQNQQTQPGFECRPVTSREEAVAVQVDFFGPGTVMPDLSHGMMYLKRFNPDTGGSDFLEFAYCPPPKPAPPAEPYDPRPEIQAMREELAALRAELEEKKAGAKKPDRKAEEK